MTRTLANSNPQVFPRLELNFHFLLGHFLFTFTLDNSNFRQIKPFSIFPEGSSYQESTVGIFKEWHARPESWIMSWEMHTVILPNHICHLRLCASRSPLLLFHWYRQFSGDNKWKYVFKLNSLKVVKKVKNVFSLLIQLLSFGQWKWITAIFPTYFSERPTWPPMHPLLGYLALGVDGKGYEPSSS